MYTGCDECLLNDREHLRLRKRRDEECLPSSVPLVPSAAVSAGDGGGESSGAAPVGAPL